MEVSGVGCPAYALLSYGVASRCQEKTQKLKAEICPSESPPSGRAPGLVLGI